MSTPTLADFLKELFTENVTKLLQPANLVVALIFVILNQLFVSPLLSNEQNPIAFIFSYFFNLSPAWQIITTSSIVLVVAYLLLNMTDDIRDIMSGELWKNTGLGKKFSEREERRREWKYWVDKELLKEQKKPREKLLFKAEHLPTRLGNELNYAAHVVCDQHHIAAETFWIYYWPRMERVLDSDEFLARNLNSRKANLDFLLNLTCVLALFAAELIVISLIWRQDVGVWILAVIFLLLAYCIYCVGVSAAEAWSALIIVAFETHLDKLRQVLHLRQPKGRKDEQTLWENYSLYWKLNKPCSNLFSEPVPDVDISKPRVMASSGVAVEIDSTIVNLKVPESHPASSGPTPTIKYIYQYIYYTLLITRPLQEPSSNRPLQDGSSEDIFIVVLDPQVPIIESIDTSKPIAKDWRGGEHTATVLTIEDEAAVQGLQWNVKPQDLPPGGSLVLHYRLPSRMLRATTNKPELSLELMITKVLAQGPDVVKQFQLSPDKSSINSLLESAPFQPHVYQFTINVGDHPPMDNVFFYALHNYYNSDQYKSLSPYEVEIFPPSADKPPQLIQCHKQPDVGYYCWSLGPLAKEGKYVLQYKLGPEDEMLYPNQIQ